MFKVNLATLNLKIYNKYRNVNENLVQQYVHVLPLFIMFSFGTVNHLDTLYWSCIEVPHCSDF